MNYIHKIQADLAAKTAQVQTMRNLLVDFRMFLASPKFQGFETDGSRRDWIAARDVDARVCQILMVDAEGSAS